MKRALSGILLPALAIVVSPFLTSCATAPRETVSGATPVEWSVRLADAEMERINSQPKWDYAMGLFTLSLLRLDAVTNDPRYVTFAEDRIGSLIAKDGTIHGYKPSEDQLDAVNPGKTALALWKITGDDKYRKAAEILRRQLDTQPRTYDGGFWHKRIYTNQMWLDGVYMAEPFYAEYGKMFNEPADFADAVKQIHLAGDHLFDPRTGLYYHGWDAAKIQSWANPATGCSSNFWGRAVGWYAMALVDTLDYLPTNQPGRAEVVSRFQNLCRALEKFQDHKTGLWYQVLDQGDRPGNYLEATASSMFVYAMAKGVNQGYLARDFIPAIRRGYRGIIMNLVEANGDETWSLTQCCSVAGLGFKNSAGRPRDGSFAYYVSEPVVDNDLKGLGPLILAGIEVQHLPD